MTGFSPQNGVDLDAELLLENGFGWHTEGEIEVAIITILVETVEAVEVGSTDRPEYNHL